MRRKAHFLRALVQWLRQVAPPAWTIVLVAVFVGLFQLAVGATAAFEGWELASQMHRVRDGLLVFAAGVYGMYRVFRSHPLFHKEYREFLARSPWDRRHPLPLAPLVLVPQDAVFLGLLLAPFAFRPMLSPALVPLAFLVAHLLVLVLALVLTGEPWFAWIVAFALGLAVRLAEFGPWPMLVVAALAYPLAWWGVWRSLAAFPWDGKFRELPTWQREYFESQQRQLTLDKSRREIDVNQFWPWKALAFTAPERMVDLRHAWAWSGLAGFYVYAVMSLTPVPSDPVRAADFHSFTAFWMAMAGMAAALLRLFSYVSMCHSPLSLWGRLRLGQYIIPAYDVVAVTPLAVACLGVGLYPLLAWLGVPLAVGVGATAAVLLGIALTGGPRLRKWRLTAPARLAPLIRPQGEIEAI